MKTLTKIIATSLVVVSCAPAVAMVCNTKEKFDSSLLQEGFVKTVDMEMSVLDNVGNLIEGKGEFWLSPDSITAIMFVKDGYSCLVAFIEKPVSTGI